MRTSDWTEAGESHRTGAAAAETRRDPVNLTIEFVTTLEGIAALRRDYEQLNRSMRNALPFAMHEWHHAWCGEFLEKSAHIEDRPLFYVLRDDAGLCIAIFPLIISRRRFGVMQIVTLNMLGADPAITEIRTPLIAPGFERLAAQVVRQSLADLRTWDWVQWTGIDDTLRTALQETGGLQWQPNVIDYILDLTPTWEEFRTGLKRNIRESLRHCYNSLKRAGLSYELVVAIEPAAVRAALGRFMELHAMRAAMPGTTPHPNFFASAVAQRFLHRVCESLAKIGAVRLFQLKIGDEIVAARIGFVVGDGLYLYYSGFDPAWARYSVMTTTVAEALKYAISMNLKTVNLSPGTDPSKTRWGPRVVEYHEAIDQRDRLRSRIARQIYVSARSGKGMPGQMLRRIIQGRRIWN